jgi:sugar (pentulose or hexulose) kinase
MEKIPVVAIFDIGKTNKKLLVFDRQYRLVHEQQVQWPEVYDDDGFRGDDLDVLTTWLRESFEELLHDERFEVRALNFSGYGASFVHLDAEGVPVTPLYNYLKTFPHALHERFFTEYGPVESFATQTASPDLGLLNSGLQLYWLKYAKPEVYARIEHALHLPQYASFVFTGRPVSEITSLGCHTALWDFRHRKYHRWVAAEGLHALGQMVLPSFVTLKKSASDGPEIEIGVGMHDSSAALVPYLRAFDEPFLLLSTGTWCITLNPFSVEPLRPDELRRDCLCYLSYRGEPVKASRLFAGSEHERATKHLAQYFQRDETAYQQVAFDHELLSLVRNRFQQVPPERAEWTNLKDSSFADRNLNAFSSYEEAYVQLVLDLMAQQIASIRLARGGTPIRRLFVDGGFSRNPWYMTLLAEAFPELEVYASELAQASALGAALAVEAAWNSQNPFDAAQFSLKKIDI